jgi:hypothetical protein
VSASRPADKLICLVPAAVLGGVAMLMEWRAMSHDADYLRIPGFICAGIAALLTVLALLAAGRPQRLLRTGSILLLNTMIVFAIVEAGGRVARVDYNALLRLKEKNERFPVFFRLPARPVGDVFFARDASVSWTGRPLATVLKNINCPDDAYQAEAEVTIRYDKDGFRNPDSLADWDIAVVGDSFTESGYLPDNEIFTGILAATTGRRVKNLGISDTGNFSHNYFLKAYGQSPSCRTAVLAFFEGNDLGDDIEELKDLAKFKATGERPSREIGPEPSLLRTLYHLGRDFDKMKFRPRSLANATYLAKPSAIPVTIADAPPAPENMSAKQKAALGAALDTWAQTCRELKMESWLLYLPCKRRVLHGHLQQGAGYPEPGWQPNDLPRYVAGECADRGIRFVDATPPLVDLAAEGVLTFNPIYDTHFNREGHRAVGQALAAALKANDTPPPAIRTASQ